MRYKNTVTIVTYITLVVLFSFLPFQIKSQDLKDKLLSDSLLVSTVQELKGSFFNFPIVKDEIDDFYKTREISVSRIEPWVLEKQSNTWSSLYINSIDENIIINFRTRGLGCVSENFTRMLLLLDNEDIINFHYIGELNCNPQKWVKFSFNESDSVNQESFDKLHKIISSDVKTIRIETENNFVDYVPVNLSDFRNRTGFLPYYYDVFENDPLSPGISFVGEDIDYQKGDGRDTYDTKLEEYDLEYGSQ